MVAEKAGFNLPVKYTRVPVKVMELYLTVHPEIVDRDCRNFVYDFPKNPTKDQQTKASRSIRMALEQIYHQQVSDKSTLEPYSVPETDELDEAFAVLEMEEMLKSPDEDWHSAPPQSLGE
jgi:hypothetical protein